MGCTVYEWDVTVDEGFVAGGQAPTMAKAIQTAFYYATQYTEETKGKMSVIVKEKVYA